MGDFMGESIITFIGGVFTGLLASFFAHRFSTERDKRKEHNDAVAKFHAAFLPEVRKIQHLIDYDPQCEKHVINILKEAYDKHHEASIQFEINLSPSERYAFNKAWDEYTQKEVGQRWMTKNIGDSVLIAYSSEYNCTEEKENRRIVIHRIQNLLSFARRK
jgi:hypothetical protein